MALRATKATTQAIGRSMSSLIVLERHLWLTMMEIKEADKFPSSTLRFCQAACLDQLWRALLNTSRRLRSRLWRFNTSSLSAPALLLHPVAPDLRRLSRAAKPTPTAPKHQPPEGRRDRGRSCSAQRYTFPKRQGPRSKIALDPAPQKSS